MSFQITYTRLFHCQIWHSYFLQQPGQNFYELLEGDDANADEIAQLLSGYDLRTLCQVEIHPASRATMRGFRLRMAKTATGFFVGMSSQPTELERRRPTIPVAEDTIWYFGLRIRDKGSWEATIEQAMTSPFPAIYYFSNQRPDWENRDSMSLSASAAELQNRQYTAGEFVQDADQLYRAIATVAETMVPANEADFWSKVAIDQQELTGRDRCLLPSFFTYSIYPRRGERPSSLEVRLLRMNGEEVVSPIVLSLRPGQSAVQLDFRTYSPKDSLRAEALIPGWYDLSITSNTAYTTSHRIYIHDALYDPTYWGVIGIGAATVHEPLRLFEEDGSFRTSAGVNGEQKTTTPVFEIRLPNRYSYCRYVPYPGQDLPPTGNFTQDQAGRLVSPQPLGLNRFGLRQELPVSNNNRIPLPSPTASSLRVERDGRVYADSYLGPIALPIN